MSILLISCFLSYFIQQCSYPISKQIFVELPLNAIHSSVLEYKDAKAITIAIKKLIILWVNGVSVCFRITGWRRPRGSRTKDIVKRIGQVYTDEQNAKKKECGSTSSPHSRLEFWNMIHLLQKRGGRRKHSVICADLLDVLNKILQSCG